jgi:hypothetical protein
MSTLGGMARYWLCWVGSSTVVRAMRGVGLELRMGRARVVLVVLALAGAVLGGAGPAEGGGEQRRQGVALLGGGGLEQVVARDLAGGLRWLVEPRGQDGRAAPPVLYGLVLAAVLVVAAVAGRVARPVWWWVPLGRAPAALGSRAPPRSAS